MAASDSDNHAVAEITARRERDDAVVPGGAMAAAGTALPVASTLGSFGPAVVGGIVQAWCMTDFQGYAGARSELDVIDVSFDFRSDTPPGKDPDSHSPTLRRFHQLLWSKPLPDGRRIEWDTTQTWRYLHHRSSIGEFFLSSDAVMASYARWVRMRDIISQLTPEQIEEFDTLGYTMGGMMVWPSDRREGVHTINSERGFNSRISDRMDLTMECVRRYYQGQDSPLSRTFDAYSEFFDLFTDFEGFTDFFLLDDLLDPHSGDVTFFMPFHDFDGPSRPTDLAEYMDFREASMDFIRARNRRISAWAPSEAN
ncbi:hypothetical protein QQX09_08045 [Demequina sp. SYSU T00192]|uniref:Uncharacterized protein n=1 Tax=Demequina litoralis TaxID=3051660 RepID=A0ABT8G9J9_9MICO|nr:hypothetical protein [Demequina sp. SYSU T00192]MDN4475806.1 hypothetical protein [Demequina sp. SYSU T00192]